MQDHPLYRIGELSKLAGVSPRTIDFYTSMGLIEPEMRSATNYRLYSDETLLRLKRIVQMKKDKYSLDEIKSNYYCLAQGFIRGAGLKQLSDLQLHLEQLQREVQELEPVLSSLKPHRPNSCLNGLYRKLRLVWRR